MPRPSILIVRPEATGVEHGGDEVVYRQTLKRMRDRYDLKFFYVRKGDRITQLIETLKGAPGEVARYISADNAARLYALLHTQRFDLACFFNEAVFSYSPVAAEFGLPRVLVAHNAHSLVAETDPSLVGKLIRPMAIAFERRFYADPEVSLVCIAECDRVALRKIGISRSDVALSPPGAPPALPLAARPRVLAEAILTGSYAWWRKRRDLQAFAVSTGSSFPVWVEDPSAALTLSNAGLDVRQGTFDGGDIRFGLVTDRFVGGFKLKSTEYVSRNCIVLTCSDIRSEFEGLPHAAEFVRLVANREDAAAVMQACLSSPGVADRFAEFRTACLQRFDWDRCLLPLIEVIESKRQQNSRTKASETDSKT